MRLDGTAATERTSLRSTLGIVHLRCWGIFKDDINWVNWSSVYIETIMYLQLCHIFIICFFNYFTCFIELIDTINDRRIAATRCWCNCSCVTRIRIQSSEEKLDASSQRTDSNHSSVATSDDDPVPPIATRCKYRYTFSALTASSTATMNKAARCVDSVRRRDEDSLGG